jgi:ABC-type multidrug transport system fused ATPase/permease subunit
MLVDGVPLDRVGFDRWIDNVACVSQAPFLLDGTLRENIEFGKSAGDDGEERLARAVDAAGLRQLVEQLPDGLLTLVGDRGVRLSGGQRQRVAIARALYRGAHLLVLDEATSALDSLTEREVTQAIESLKGRMTLLVVAHRLSTVSRLDELVVLDDGAIAARGSHQSLLGSNKLYRMLVQAQSLNAAGNPAA